MNFPELRTTEVRNYALFVLTCHVYFTGYIRIKLLPDIFFGIHSLEVHLEFGTSFWGWDISATGKASRAKRTTMGPAFGTLHSWGIYYPVITWALFTTYKLQTVLHIVKIVTKERRESEDMIFISILSLSSAQNLKNWKHGNR